MFENITQRTNINWQFR